MSKPTYLIYAWPNITDHLDLRDHLIEAHSEEIREDLLYKYRILVHHCAHMHANFKAPFAHYHLPEDTDEAKTEKTEDTENSRN